MAQTQSVVIGGGVAGLAAATYLARGGHHVSLVERASALGGRAVSDHIAGFDLNRGAHALYTGAAASEVLHQLGVSYGFGIPKRVFAHDERGTHRLPATALDLLRTTLLDAADKRELLGLFLRLGSLSPADVATESAAAWIERMASRPRVRAVLVSIARVNLYTAALDLASADTLVARLQQTARHPVHYVNGGWQTIVDGLRAAAIDAGVAIEPPHAAQRIVCEAGRAIAVQMHGGPQLLADHVVLAVPPHDALSLLGDRAPRLQQALADVMPAHIACLDVALTRLPNPSAPVVFDMQRPVFVTAQSAVARVAPDGAGVIHVLKQLDPRTPTDEHTDLADMETVLDEAQPGWRDVLVERRFLPRMLGSSSIPLAANGGMAGRPAHRCDDVPNLYFAGDWIGPSGYLVDASLGSARQAAQLILHSSQLRRAQQPAA